MHVFESLFAAVVCLAHIGFTNALAFTEWPSTIYAGEPNTVNWIGDPDVPATITLRRGASTNLDDVEVLTDQARGNTYTWTAREDLEDGSDYALQIRQNGEVNYSGLLAVAHHPGHQAPSSKGPPPDRNPDSPNFDTAPHASDAGVAKGNNAAATPSNKTEDEVQSTGNNLTSSKSAVAAKMQTGDASRNLSPDLILAAIAILYLNL
ncbi:hypothetical protein ETB97_001084 [Aspergillus alliaceus]|uniref:Yeast cell wall synthesis Kre9/Knh1-like N-terminal domain-containing protein n=1 Tax=Petromyces alliaceus TaxID=209559 RepID=A0A5N7BYV6_PETAA|nr:uncharacterized protein BDW43DRAFT_306376 [Aspergillus alliaceus]KAB8238516.1 hypothetical protein BDW43DRAFT_306376 [Aspergillus alliaceus]KAE8386758.1 hypothetical protein BDV23DRAFT_186965 [Aspergillus alliaceus]KAF5866008.1 hypothetical protein ETB97_001084 [Aspergillus burnettii]